MTSNSSLPSDASRIDRFGPWLLGALAFLPLVWWAKEIGQFFWFGDDLDLLDQIAHAGLGPWIVRPWAESWSPVFKAAWGSGVFVFHGSYFAMLALIWLTNALTVTLLARVLRRCGFGWSGIAPALILLGLSATNIETFCWSVQLSPALANMFLAAAIWLHVSRADARTRWTWSRHGLVVLCVTASALSYSRGVLSGLALGALALVPLAGEWTWKNLRARLLVAASYIAPAIAITVVILLATKGNQNTILSTGAQRAVQIAAFATWYFCLNPFFALVAPGTWGPHTAAAFGLLKLALIAYPLWASRGAQRWVLALLLLFDLGNAALLGIGRHHTGLTATVSSRYQYCALLAVAPFVAFCVERALSRLRSGPAVQFAAVALAAILVVHLLRDWKPTLEGFVGWRGAQPRAVLLGEAPVPPDYQLPGIPGLPPARARELIARYHLH